MARCSGRFPALPYPPSHGADDSRACGVLASEHNILWFLQRGYHYMLWFGGRCSHSVTTGRGHLAVILGMEAGLQAFVAGVVVVDGGLWGPR